MSTTTNPTSSSKGAITLYCQAPDGTEITVRTAVLYDESGNLITQSYFEGKMINVKGIVDYYDPSNGDAEDVESNGFYYQVKLLSLSDVTILES